MTSWSNIPEDVKRIIVGPLNRIDRQSLRQCSHGDKLFVELVTKPIREINFMARRSSITIQFDEEYEDTFEHKSEEGSTVVRRSKNLLPYTSFTVNEDFQLVAWRSLQKMLKCQNNRIESLNFSFLLSFNQDVDEPERIVPNLPSETADVKSLTVMMDCSEDLTYQIVQFVKPNLHYLNLSMTVKDVTLPSRVGDLEQVKTAQKVYSLLKLSREQSMELQGYEIVNKSTHLVDSDIADLLKKSLSTGKPSKFEYYRMWPEPSEVTSGFESIPWSVSTAEEFKNIRENFQLDLANKNFILSIPEISKSRLFVEITRFAVKGFII
ncbi:hypothetical protein GCK72_000421 [Caenorhabditis remanei]|uniref:F-box domain-containing protein n=1 Tax=Caenorhabditis remanei TaxID=31234 RepID=A0A6A5HM13_CAERE|nr:hypothetical protein GCK72_000421 [Caenorhabditis remanei]KAF1768609.1 hypothetical protein GCK72_000421 [Caenorhabditis remanei]